MLAAFADERLPAYPPQHPAIENLWKSLRLRQAKGRRAIEQQEEVPLKTNFPSGIKYGAGQCGQSLGNVSVN
jgi:hypothetical protein